MSRELLSELPLVFISIPSLQARYLYVCSSEWELELLRCCITPRCHAPSSHATYGVSYLVNETLGSGIWDRGHYF